MIWSEKQEDCPVGIVAVNRLLHRAVLVRIARIAAGWVIRER